MRHPGKSRQGSQLFSLSRPLPTRGQLGPDVEPNDAPTAYPDAATAYPDAAPDAANANPDAPPAYPDTAAAYPEAAAANPDTAAAAFVYSGARVNCDYVEDKKSLYKTQMGMRHSLGAFETSLFPSEKVDRSTREDMRTELRQTSIRHSLDVLGDSHFSKGKVEPWDYVKSPYMRQMRTRHSLDGPAVRSRFSSETSVERSAREYLDTPFMKQVRTRRSLEGSRFSIETDHAELSASELMDTPEQLDTPYMRQMSMMRRSFLDSRQLSSEINEELSARKDMNKSPVEVTDTPTIMDALPEWRQMSSARLSLDVKEGSQSSGDEEAEGLASEDMHTELSQISKRHSLDVFSSENKVGRAKSLPVGFLDVLGDDQLYSENNKMELARSLPVGSSLDKLEFGNNRISIENKVERSAERIPFGCMSFFERSAMHTSVTNTNASALQRLSLICLFSGGYHAGTHIGNHDPLSGDTTASQSSVSSSPWWGTHPRSDAECGRGKR
mmetsp:Transcript_31778/g.53388  ORF Transcript_31778/g.53388 Transcript_31778/m.53388 type:complete len:498 (+) Transcript_31778:229-1722(+)